MKCKRFLLCAISFLLLGVLTTQAEDLAKYADKVEADQGLCVLLGDPDGQVAQKLAEQTHLLVYVQLPSAEKVLAAREAAERGGIGLDQLHIAQGPPDRILLGDNLVDLVLEAGAENDVPETEVLRVLRPRGLSVNSSGEIVKPVPDGIDDWTHLYHSPDNNTQSLDTQARAPYLTQFIANPQYAPAPQAAVAAGGRVFKAYGNVAWHEREEPYLNTLVAYNGYNGSVLWKHSLPDGMMVHRSTFIATPDTVFVGDDQSCKLLDAVTGQLREEIKPPTELAGGTFWKWMALQDDVLYALIGQQEMKDEAKRWRRQAHGWPWNEISRGHNQPVQSWGFGNDLLAIDPNTKKVLWHYHEDEPIDARATCMSSNRVFAFRFDAYLTCLDATTGEVVWRRTKENSPELFDTLGRQLHRQGWDTNWRTVAFMKCNEDALFFAGPQLSKLLVVSTEDGRVLWEDPYDNYQLVIRPEGLYAISGPWGKNVSRKFDPLTGEVLAELPVGRRACTRPTGTCDSILFRAMGGSVRYDVASAQPRWVSPMRPPCHDGVTVANGQLYWWPYVCDCQLSLYGVTCLGSAGSFDFQPDATPADRLETVDASGVDPVDPSPNDWPMFRANSRANVTSNARIPTKARELWETKPSLLDGVWPTAPVAAGGMVYLAGTDGVIRALDASTGESQWRAYTESDVRFPPTIWQGRALTASGDGWVYAHEANSGRPLWRFRAAPLQRKIPVFGNLLSTWPAASGVLVDDDVAYVAAGMVNYDGTYVYALDPSNGKMKWCNDTSGHLDAEANSGVSVQGHMLLDNGKLYLAGGNAVSPAVYDAESGLCLNDPAELAKCESTSPRGWELFLVGDRVIACGRPFYAHPDMPVYDHTITKKMLHTSTADRDIVWLDNQAVACFNPIDRQALNACVTDDKIPRHVTQAWGAFTVKDQPLWHHKCPDSIALAVTRNAVVVADGKEVRALSLITGQPIWTQPLPAAPVPWGMAVDAKGRVILTLRDGRVICFGV